MKLKKMKSTMLQLSQEKFNLKQFRLFNQLMKNKTDSKLLNNKKKRQNKKKPLI